MKKKLFFSLNIAIPLVLGLTVYLTIRNSTYINSFLAIEGNCVTNPFLVFVSNWGADILWSYSLTFAVYLSVYAFRKRLILSVIISGLVGTILEFLQYTGFVHGTFDPLDICFEIMAAVIAAIVIIRRGKNEKD